MAIFTNILTGGSNNHETTAANANAIGTDFVSEGVIAPITNTAGVAPATGSFAVNAQGTPDMTVAVSAGVAYVDATPSGQGSQTLRVENTASANVTISANSTGSTKYDWIYISVDATNAANPNTAGDNVSTLVASRSTSASSDDGTPPSYGYPIAVVTVANGASSITNGNIADVREITSVVPDNSITAEKIADGAISNAKLKTGADEPGGAWNSWTPTWTGLTVSNSTVVARYKVIGKVVHFRLSVVMGGGDGASMSNPRFTLPVTAAAYSTNADIGNATFEDTGTDSFFGVVRFNSTDPTTTGQIVVLNAASTYLKVSAVTSTVPMTWANTDILACSGTYEAGS